jgi:hypothetical protein
MRVPGNTTMGLGSNLKPTTGSVISQVGNAISGAFD